MVVPGSRTQSYVEKVRVKERTVSSVNKLFRISSLAVCIKVETLIHTS